MLYILLINNCRIVTNSFFCSGLSLVPFRLWCNCHWIFTDNRRSRYWRRSSQVNAENLNETRTELQIGHQSYGATKEGGVVKVSIEDANDSSKSEVVSSKFISIISLLFELNITTLTRVKELMMKLKAFRIIFRPSAHLTIRRFNLMIT